ncbi:MAG: twin-arginine translocase subunit TatB [Gammaproteobacteria bacterium]|nr:twin-arginine translocase subunit TatB [Gammaproteobacteria bacterium]
MFDVGFWELGLIGVIALIILGPERLPRAARTAGLWMGRARRMVREVKADIDREINAQDLQEIKNIGSELKETGNAFQQAAESMNEVVAADGKPKSTLASPDDTAAAAPKEPASPTPSS